MQAKDLCNKYKTSNPLKSSNPTHKWIEASMDIQDMRKQLLTADFFDKFSLMDALKVAERKQSAAYRNEDFDIKLANILMQDIEFMHKLLD